MRRQHHVSIVASNHETLDGLESYLGELSIVAHGTTYLERAAEITPPSYSAIIVFPDDFPEPAVRFALGEIRERCRHILTLVVTRDVHRFSTLTDAGASFLVLPKPVWAWTIADALRERLSLNKSS